MHCGERKFDLLHGRPPQHVVAGDQMLPLSVSMEPGTGRGSSSSRGLPPCHPRRLVSVEDRPATQSGGGTVILHSRKKAVPHAWVAARAAILHLVVVLAACRPSLLCGRPPVSHASAGKIPPSMVMLSSDNRRRRLGFQGGDLEREWARGGVERKKP